MKADRLLLKIYGEQNEGQWSLICLDFSLAAQADTLNEAKSLLETQIKEYLQDALSGQDREHARALLSRRAPLKYWAKWWFGTSLNWLGLHTSQREDTRKMPIPLVPA